MLKYFARVLFNAKVKLILKIDDLIHSFTPSSPATPKKMQKSVRPRFPLRKKCNPPSHPLAPLKKKRPSLLAYTKRIPQREIPRTQPHTTHRHGARAASASRAGSAASSTHSLPRIHTHTHTLTYTYIYTIHRDLRMNQKAYRALSLPLSPAHKQAREREKKDLARRAAVHTKTEAGCGWQRVQRTPKGRERERDRLSHSEGGRERERGAAAAAAQSSKSRTKRARRVGRGKGLSLSLSPCALVMVYIWGPGRLAEGASPGALWLRGGHGPLRRSSSQSPAGRGRRAHVYSVVCVTTHPLIPRTRSISVALSVCLICRGKDR